MNHQIPGVKEFRFDGSSYDPSKDDVRLTGQVLRVFNCMKDGRWRTLGEIEVLIRDPQSSISAQLRHLRKERFGSHTVSKQIRGDRETGLYEYQLLINTTRNKS
jgi:hypothetical protein